MDAEKWSEAEHSEIKVHVDPLITEKVDSKLELFVDGLLIEQVRVFKFLVVLRNDTLTWSDPLPTSAQKSLAV